MPCLILLFTQSFAQSILINSFQARAVLKDRAELDMRRKDAVTDSMAMAQLVIAFHYKDSALQESMKATAEAVRISNDYHGLYTESDKRLTVVKKEARKQSRLKWLGFGLAGLIAVLAATR